MSNYYSGLIVDRGYEPDRSFFNCRVPSLFDLRDSASPQALGVFARAEQAAARAVLFLATFQTRLPIRKGIAMKVLGDGTGGFVLEERDGEYDCQICQAQIEMLGDIEREPAAARYEFRADTGARVFVCSKCFVKYFSPE